jgi:hypothetical protein
VRGFQVGGPAQQADARVRGGQPPPTLLPTVAPTRVPTVHSLPPYCCPYPCPYCTLTPSLPSRPAWRARCCVSRCSSPLRRARPCSAACGPRSRGGGGWSCVSGAVHSGAAPPHEQSRQSLQPAAQAQRRRRGARVQRRRGPARGRPGAERGAERRPRAQARQARLGVVRARARARLRDAACPISTG